MMLSYAGIEVRVVRASFRVRCQMSLTVGKEDRRQSLLQVDDHDNNDDHDDDDIGKECQGGVGRFAERGQPCLARR